MYHSPTVLSLFDCMKLLGEGCVGTIVEIGKPENSNTPEKTAVVQWDSGNRTNYRVGYQSAFDLRVFDLAPIGKIRIVNFNMHKYSVVVIYMKQMIYWKLWTGLNIELRNPACQKLQADLMAYV